MTSKIVLTDDASDRPIDQTKFAYWELRSATLGKSFYTYHYVWWQDVMDALNNMKKESNTEITIRLIDYRTDVFASQPVPVIHPFEPSTLQRVDGTGEACDLCSRTRDRHSAAPYERLEGGWSCNACDSYNLSTEQNCTHCGQENVPQPEDTP